MIPVELDDEAENELVEAAEWYEERGHAGLGVRFVNAVGACLDEVAQAPESFMVLLTERGVVVHRHLVAAFPFQIVFTVQGQGERRSVWVLAIAHLRREPGYWLKRVP